MGQIMQEVGLKDVRFFSPIGFFKEERIIGNEFFVDIYARFPFSGQDAEQLDNTLNYAELFAIVTEVMSKERKLLESATADILDQVKNRYDYVEEISVSIRKTTPPFGVDSAHSYVSLHYKK